ncbi:mycofactocin system FadH/OYE family oxidoreductase 1 [Saccharopolyspora aridisoli]|uniref:Mycofactocin system FadH/OYE family oxidoreductase 1 n=1 Tax=Saccharopolyspora aridisoli TaxID=2530385 RepID=A0A4R4UM35_9PSEU|nr:mycofactocin system FadH/OYE family oxidoreductase 1 [Saccharopolyspora aridisoli]TDC93107.1 mycofactocin system FadH/OYE family oxidoreductase 1 [Saccharopolyspora aridisoli]
MKLVDPVRLGRSTAPSRVLFGPHETNLGRDRDISDRHVGYYAARAAGGAGVLVTETASAHDSDWPYERAPLASHCGPGWAAVAEACRPHGTVVLAGLGHSGSQGSSAFSQRALWAPSRVPDVASREMPMELEQDEIDALVAGFASASREAMRSGLHGVELNAGQFSLLRQFLSGLTNQRSDDYGTDRTRLLREVLAAVREAVGDGVVGLRLSCDELAPWAGITPEAAVGIVESVRDAVDYLVVVRGSAMGTTATRPDLHTEPGFNIDLCRWIRGAAGGTPVVLQGSVVEPDQAQRALDDGVADLVEMTRAQIADPDLVAEVRDGTPVRPCVLCNQKCNVRDNRNPIVTCIVNPSAGHETEDPPVPTETRPQISTEVRRRSSTGVGDRSAAEGRFGSGEPVLVVGGGPAGLEAARVLALRGRTVEVVERGDQIGGMVRIAAEVAGRGRLSRFVEWLEEEVRRLGVQVRLGVEAGPEDVAGREVVVATGSVPGPWGFKVEGGVVLDVVEALTGETPEGPVVVHDPVGDFVGVGVAELLAGRGVETAIVTQDQVVGTQLALTGDLADANARLQRAGVALEKRSLLREVRNDHVVLEDVHTAETRERLAATVVHCGHRLPDQRLDGVRIGDCVAPRTVHEAILEGRRAAGGLR